MAAATDAGAALPVAARLATPPLRALLAALGLVLLAVAAFVAWQHASVPAPYRYQAAQAHGHEPVRWVQVVAADGDQVIAEAEVATDASGPLLLDWHAKVDEPLLHLVVPADETRVLAAVVARHRGPATPVLGWWDTSRQLAHWGGGEMYFDRHLGVPLFVPKAWAGRREKISQVEQAFWGGAAAPQQRAAFETFARALVSPEDEGVKLLRSLVPGRKALLVLHLRDVIALGEMFPAKLGVSFQDFADPGDVHRSVRGVQGWLREGSHAAYSVTKLPGNLLRAVALRDEASADTLIARLLPFIGNRQDDVRGLTLVYRTGGYSVFELAPADPGP